MIFFFQCIFQNFIGLRINIIVFHLTYESGFKTKLSCDMCHPIIFDMGSKCRFIGWFDPPILRAQSSDIIIGLLRLRNQLESKIKERENKEKG